ncbi:MAG: hypothetical protein GF364_08060, partial [Candidatus Lokiarchaeota archaeon]|nr:hypothetical protein [Candidatus Lokiarchaeota archaeon]
DIILGSPFWAPGTLVIKGIEGFVVGWVFQRLKKSEIIEKYWKLFTIILSLLLSGILIIVGIYIIELDVIFVIVFGMILLCISTLLGLTIQKDTGIKLASIIPGGIILVLGYFLYISFILDSIRPGFYADWAENPLSAGLWELPWDVMQFLISTVIAIPLIAAIEPLVKKYYR